MKKRLRKGQMVSIEFLDHCIGTTSPILCKAFGVINQITKKHIELSSWIVLNEDKETTKANTEQFIIVRSAIQKINHLIEE